MNDPEPVLLERRYRAALRLLPASYRAEREEEMVAAFLEMSGDVPDERGPRPRWGELASVAALAVRVRLGGAGARAAAWGETVRLVALLGLAYQATLGVHGLVWRAASAAAHLPVLGAAPSPFPVVADVLWVVAFVAVMRGFTGPAKVTAVAAGTVSLLLIGAGPGDQLTWAAPPAALMASVPVLALLAGFHAEAPATVRPWRLLLPPVAAVLPSVLLLRAPLPWDSAFEPLLALSSLFLPDAIAAVACAVAGVVALRRGWAPSARLALAAAGTLLLAWRLPMAWPVPGAEVVWGPAAVLCGVLAVVIPPLAVTGRRLLPPARRMRPGRAA
ncbi:hypothetical protein [Nonomuraea rhodomycinica]|uniref:Uncharacterized protein n=1 Tax=Nonomuraea rhodomycinica TaxID=1712872 RepID=A0A7Y6MB99_9ACTN|nr:hypothetical protein [Nonomuraea rhodomycinica]NUW40531.1 hypothetical protein [Nonomuraea rhodomycinica]